LSQAGTAVAQVRAGYTVDVSDGATIEILHPQAEPKITDKLNDHVLALQLRYGDASFLLTSDLSAEGQQAMLDSAGAMGATVLQIPQHGTARALDDDFLAAVKPQIALLQSDIANRRGDPDPDTLAELEEVDLFRTDELGTIHLRTDGKTISVSR